MMKTKLLLTAVLAGAALAGGQAARAGDATGGTTVAYNLRFLGPTAVVNVHPHARHSVQAEPLPGDALYARSRVSELDGRRAGRTSEACTMTVRRPATFDCSLALIFRDGSQLLVRGAIDPMRTPWTAPVVGGTGRYAGASGTVRVTDFHEGERWTFTLG
jgi:hypothetical protein